MILSETHFNIRTKCPEGFYTVGRSKEVVSSKPRGGVAVYKNKSSSLKLNIILDSLMDCVIFEICNTPIIIIAIYIPPNNSAYFDDTYFNNLMLVMNHFKDRHVYIMGDMNSRIGTPEHEQLQYNENPDNSININGRALMKILDMNKRWCVMNGIKDNNKTFETKFTFYRGEVCSQNDLCITNCIEDIQEFYILPKLPESDHCPCKMRFTTKPVPDLRIVEECARNFKRYEHYDINRRIPKAINLAKVDTARLYIDLETLALELRHDILNEKDNDFVCNKLTSNLYTLCLKNYVSDTNRQPDSTNDIPNYANCSSHNIRAIAEANFECFQYHLTAKTNQELIEIYKGNWLRYEKIALNKENIEHNTKVNKKWANCSKDAKELWKMIDWKGSVQEDDQNELSFQEIYRFFLNIFQSKKTSKSPVIADSKNKLDQYNVYIPITDADITIEEVNQGIRNIGNGVGLDGLPPEVAKILPQSIKEVLVPFFQNVFCGKYPNMWENQLLFPSKKERTYNQQPQTQRDSSQPIVE